MTIRAVVRGVGHYLPERIVPNSWFEDKIDTSDEWIRSRSGIERRHFAAEGETTSDLATHAANAALAAGLIPVMCIGESEAERDAGQTFSVLDKQVINGLEGLFSNDLGSLVIAYEPVWAIGTGKTASDDQAQEAHQYIRELVDRQFGKALANTVRILYGGSVKPSNVKALMAMPDVDGALVGGASLEAESFSQLAHYQA